MLNPLRILRTSSKITLVSAISAPINFALSIFVARMLLPEELGRINFISLWLSYAVLITPGTFYGAQREMIHRLGRNEPELARQAQNVGLTAEMLWSLLPFSFFLFTASFFAQDPLKQWGFVIVSIIFLVATLSKLLANLHMAHQRFELYARFALVRVLLAPLLIFLCLQSVGPLMFLAAAALAEFALLLLYLTRAPKLDLALELNWPQLKKLTLAGLPLGLGGLVYWAYRLMGQTFVAVWFPAQTLAFYTFSATIVTMFARAFGDFSGVLTPALWKELGQSGSSQQLYRETAYISIFIMTVTCAVANLTQAGFAPLIQLILPKYLSAIPVFEALAFNIVVLTMTFIPSLVLDSTILNKQWPHLWVWLIGLAINCGVNYLVIRFGWGPVAIAWNDIWVQFIVVIGLYAIAQKYLYPNSSIAIRVYLILGFLGMVAIVVFVILHSLMSVSALTPTLLSTITLVAMRAGFTLIVWGIISTIILNTRIRKFLIPSFYRYIALI